MLDSIVRPQRNPDAVILSLREIRPGDRIVYFSGVNDFKVASSKIFWAALEAYKDGRALLVQQRIDPSDRFITSDIYKNTSGFRYIAIGI